MDLVVTISELAARLPSTEQFELSRELRKSAVSIPSNVAEGQACGGKRYRNHVRFALGSLAELDTQLEVTKRVKLLPAASLAAVERDVERTGKLLHGLSRSLRLRQLRDTALGCVVMCVILLLWS